MQERIERQIVIRTPSGIPAKKNNLRPGGRKRGYHYDPQTKQIIDGIILAARGEWIGLPVLTEIDIAFHFDISSMRQDLDSKETTTLDVLKKAGVIRDDSPTHMRNHGGRTWLRVGPYQDRVVITISGVPAPALKPRTRRRTRRRK